MASFLNAKTDFLSFDVELHYESEIFEIIFKSSHPGENGHHFADNIFRCNFMNEKYCILIEILLKFTITQYSFR